MKYKIIISIIILAFTTSCNDWLDISSKTEKKADEFLSTEVGYKGALVGLYIKIKNDNLYGNNLTMGFVEYLAQHWESQENTYGNYVSKFNYDNSDVESTIQSIYASLYNIIAEANMILEHIDDNIGVFQDERTAALIKGETLGIRAWCHFELLRLFGPIPSGSVSGEKVFPYVKVFSKKNQPNITYGEYTALLLSDLEEAEKLLQEVDPITMNSLQISYDFEGGEGFLDNLFWKYRQTRMNYFAVCGLKARACLWIDNKPEALKYARKVIDAVIPATSGAGRKIFNLGGAGDLMSNQRILPTEHIFVLEIVDLDALYRERFRNIKTGNYQQSRTDVGNLYEAADRRYAYLWGTEVSTSGGGLDIFTILKYKQADIGESSAETIIKNKIPLMRLSEMYFIAIECGDPDATSLYNSFMERRGLSTVIDVNSLDLKTVLMKEYAREFYAEGQAFVNYKRLGFDYMFIGINRISNPEGVYVLPLPVRESVYQD